MHSPFQLDALLIRFLLANLFRFRGIGRGILFASFLSVAHAAERFSAFDENSLPSDSTANAFEFQSLRFFEREPFASARSASLRETLEIEPFGQLFNLTDGKVLPHVMPRPGSAKQKMQRDRAANPFESDRSHLPTIIRAQSPYSAPTHEMSPYATSLYAASPMVEQPLFCDGLNTCPMPCGPPFPGSCPPAYWDQCLTDPCQLTFCNDVRDLPKRWKSDLSALATCENVLFLGAAAGITVAVRDNVDERVSHDLQTHGPRWGQFSNVLSHGGDPLVVHAPILAAMYLTSLYEQDEDLHELTLTMFTSYKFAILGSVGLQYLTNTHESHGGFFNLLGDNGFPSEPTAGSFALAAVIDERFGWRGGLPAYLISGLIGFSEIDQQRHTVSDVVFGAALGYVIGKSIGAQRYHPNAPYKLVPFYDAVSGTQGMGFQVVY